MLASHGRGHTEERLRVGCGDGSQDAIHPQSKAPSFNEFSGLVSPFLLIRNPGGANISEITQGRNHKIED